MDTVLSYSQTKRDDSKSMATLYLTAYEYINTRAFSAQAGVLSQPGQRHIIISQTRCLVTCSQTRHRRIAGASPPGPAGREEVINHNILIIKGTKVDLAVRHVGRRGVRVLRVTGGFCGDNDPLFQLCSFITTPTSRCTAFNMRFVFLRHGVVYTLNWNSTIC